MLRCSISFYYIASLCSMTNHLVRFKNSWFMQDLYLSFKKKAMSQAIIHFSARVVFIRLKKVNHEWLFEANESLLDPWPYIFQINIYVSIKQNIYYRLHTFPTLVFWFQDFCSTTVFLRKRGFFSYWVFLLLIHFYSPYFVSPTSRDSHKQQ